MANPQIENGHVDIANKIVEALAKTQLSGHESRVLWALWRKTWGWVKKDKEGKTIKGKKGQPLKLKSALITSKCWEGMTGLNKYIISRTLRELNLRRIVTKFDNKNRWGFQKDYDQWLQPIQKIVTKNGNAYFVTKNGNAFSKIDNTFNKIDNKMFRKLSRNKALPASKETLKETIKESNKEKAPINKKLYLNKVYLTDDEHQELIKEYGKDKTENYIEDLNRYIVEYIMPGKRKPYQSHYLTIRAWIRKDEKRESEDDEPERPDVRKELKNL